MISLQDQFRINTESIKEKFPLISTEETNVVLLFKSELSQMLEAFVNDCHPVQHQNDIERARNEHLKNMYLHLFVLLPPSISNMATS